MGWIEKDQPTLFDNLPIHGLFFLSGDALALILLKKLEAKGIDVAGKKVGTEGYKMPKIGFPSGETFQLFESSDPTKPNVHIFGEMDLQLYATIEQGTAHAQDIAEQVGYAVQRVGENQLEVKGFANGDSWLEEREHYLITYDAEKGRIVDIEQVKLKPGEKFEPPRMELLTNELRAKLPKLYANEKLGMNAIAQVKFFTPDAQWTWYATEFDGEDTFFGLVVGFEMELGYFLLSELQEVRGGLGLPVERDKFFEPTTLKELQAQHRRERGEM